MSGHVVLQSRGTRVDQPRTELQHQKRLSADERNRLIADSATFFRVSSDCYVNIKNISDIGEHHLFFEDTTKRLPCSGRKQQMIRQLLG